MRTFEEVQDELRECINHAYRDECEDMQKFGSNVMHLDNAIQRLNELIEIHKGEWIPVSERLPETHQDVLLELRSGEMLTGFKAETEPYFYCHGVDGCYVEPQNVLAWMPLPEPYKEGDKAE